MFVALAALVLTVPIGGSAGAEPGGGGPLGVGGSRPNIVVVMMDDMTLQQLAYLPKVNALLKAQGTSFTNFYVNTPECCPSRATFLSGQYQHNHQVLSGIPPTGGYARFDTTNSLPVWLHDSGYYTAHVGKFLNGIKATDRPAGWSDYYGLFEPTNYNYFNYDINHNGTLEHHGTAAADYQTDVLGQHAVDVINSQAGTAQPFFLYFAPLAPHAGTRDGTGAKYPVPPPRYDGTMKNVAQPKTPDYNEADVSDKPAYIQSLASMTTLTQFSYARWWQQSIEAERAADDWVAHIVDALAATNQLATTDIIFTSDNGFFHGEHRLFQKLAPYEADLHMPLIVRGPGFAAGAQVTQRTINADLAPTIVALAGAQSFVRRVADGWSLLPMRTSPTYGANRPLLFELGSAMGRETYAAVRGDQWKFIKYSTGEEELYNLKTDPFELTNRAHDPTVAAVRGAWAARLNQLRTCAGATCTGAP